jgi:hypothetical protein
LAFGLFVAVADQSTRVDAAEQGGFTASAVEMGKTGLTGNYSLPEPPGYPLPGCIATGGTLKMYDPGYISVGAINYFYTQKAVVTEAVFQRRADGSYSLFQTGNSVEVPLNFNYPVAAPVITSFSYLPVGPDYVIAYHIDWQRAVDSVSLGSVDVAYSLYHRELDGKVLSNASVCGGLRSPSVVTNTSTGTVNSTTSFTLQYFPTKTVVPILWDGKQIGSILTGPTSFTDGSFVVPAAPTGPHTVQWKYGHWSTKITYTVKPRIKLIPSAVSRGQTVNISLRGYAKNEVVKIRWKKGSSWVQVGQVTTSSTGSANVNVKVPTFAPNGSAAVRGDGSYGHAQTNAVTVSGGAPLTSSAVKPATPTPTPTKTSTATTTPTPEATIVPATPEATATTPVETSTPEATSSPETATPEPSPTATAEPTETPTPTEESSTPTPGESLEQIEATPTP